MKKLHLISNAHIDTIWQWEWGEGMSAALSTFQSAVNLMEKHDYIFCHNESSLYKYTEKYAPELFRQIQRRVAQGRWHVMGGWYLQPDCMLGNGESYIRQIREGMLFFAEKFGEQNRPKTAVCFDAFGHNRGLVQIIKKCGQENYLFMRPYGEHILLQLELPGECFLWEGYDGSTLKALRGTEYSSALGHAAEKIRLDMERLKDEEIAVSLWGVGNHGGGPSDKDLTDITELIKESQVEILHSTPDAFFSEVQPDRVYAGSLISCNIGCYTSMVGLKQKYRQLERELFFVEKMLSIAHLKGVYAYPVEQVKGITEDLLTVMFHDVLPGTCIRAGEDNALRYINHGLKELEQLKLDCFFALIKGQPVAEADTYPIFVFNPKSYEAEQLVECELSVLRNDDYEEETSNLVIFDEAGNQIPCQTIKEDSNINLDWRKRVVFRAKLKPLAITRFTVKTQLGLKPKYPYGQDIRFDNGEMQVRISKDTGLLESYVVDGVEYAQGGMFQLFSYDDTLDPWAMSDKERREGLGENPEAFRLMTEPDGVFRGLKNMEVIEDGDIYTAVEAFFASGLTRARIGYKLYKTGPVVDIDVDLFPAEAGKCVKLHIPVAAQKYIGQQVFGKEELYMDGREAAAHDFVAAQTDGRLLQILTPDSFGTSYRDGSARLTLLRNANYTAHPLGDRPLVRSNIFLPRMDQAQRSYRLRILPAAEEELQRNADLFAERPFSLNIFPTVDTSADNGYAIHTSNPNIALVTMFRARETEGFLLRLQNNSQEPAQTAVTCGEASCTVDFGKYEVKTLRLLDGKLEEMDAFLI